MLHQRLGVEATWMTEIRERYNENGNPKPKFHLALILAPERRGQHSVRGQLAWTRQVERLRMEGVGGLGGIKEGRGKKKEREQRAARSTSFEQIVKNLNEELFFETRVQKLVKKVRLDGQNDAKEDQTIYPADLESNIPRGDPRFLSLPLRYWERVLEGIVNRIPVNWRLRVQRHGGIGWTGAFMRSEVQEVESALKPFAPYPTSKTSTLGGGGKDRKSRGGKASSSAFSPHHVQQADSHFPDKLRKQHFEFLIRPDGDDDTAVRRDEKLAKKLYIKGTTTVTAETRLWKRLARCAAVETEKSLKSVRQAVTADRTISPNEKEVRNLQQWGDSVVLWGDQQNDLTPKWKSRENWRPPQHVVFPVSPFTKTPQNLPNLID